MVDGLAHYAEKVGDTQQKPFNSAQKLKHYITNNI